MHASLRRGWALLLAALTLFSSSPAPAAGRAVVAVVGVHGGDQWKEAELQRLSDAIATGFRSADVFDVLDGDALSARLAPEGDRIADAVFVDPVRKAFEAGRVLYENAQFDRAIENLTRASSGLDNAGAFLRDGRLPVDVQLYLGLAYATTNQTDLARDAFTEVVRLDPNRLLDENDYPPKIVSLFEEVRSELLARQRGVVVVRRSGVRVWVDGRHLGQGPLQSPELPPGFHTVSLDGGAAGRAFVAATVNAGQQLLVDPPLAPPSLALGPGDPWEGGRSPVTRSLYENVGRATGAQLVAVAGFDADGNLRIALWSTRNGAISAAVSASLGASPGDKSAFVGQLVERLCLFADASGALKPDRVATDPPPLRLGANPRLTALLFGPGDERTPTPIAGKPEAKRKDKVPAGAIVGIILGAAGAAALGTVAGFATRPEETPTGTLTVVLP